MAMEKRTAEPAREPVAKPGARADHGGVDADWADLTEWVAGLCRKDSERLPAALWLISTSTSPLELFEPTAQERQFVGQLVATFEESKAVLVALHAQAPKGSGQASCLWSDLGDVVKRLFEKFPEQFRVGLSFLCSFGKEFEKRLELGHPTDAELESLLADLDRCQPFLLSDVLKMMAAKPSAGAVASRWRPPERPREEIIARKLASFNRMVFKLLVKADEDAHRLMDELVEVFRERPKSAPENVLETGFVDLPLGTLLTIEQIIDDERLSITGKIVAVNELLTGDGP
ncbi:MAG: hypothetical protein GY856_54995, partial [bacterium]|nr:hypothetical protein [bacterium]